jgi:hypothetical protein
VRRVAMCRQVLIALAVSALSWSCGGNTEETVTPAPLPAAFAFDYIWMALSGGAEVVEGDPLTCVAELDGAASDAGPHALLAPVQYGIGYEYAVTASVRLEVGDCRDTPDNAPFVSECTTSLTGLRLTVIPDPKYPDTFMDNAIFGMSGARGTAHYDNAFLSYELVFEKATLVAETRTGASRSEYEATLSGSVTAGHLDLSGSLTK